MVKEVYIGETVFFSALRGYGFLRWEKDGIPQKDMFVHFTDLKMDGFRTLAKDQRVSFSIGANNNGDAKAIEVVICA